MLFEYSKWDHEKQSVEQRMKDLMNLFDQLLNASAGDVEQALEWLDRIANQYKLWNEKLDFEKFKEQLKQSGKVTDGPRGQLKLSPKGEKGMRQTALNEMFGDMLKGSAGQHAAHAPGPDGERQPSVRQYAFGDELWSISPTDTLNNAVKRSMRQGTDDISITEEDLAVYESDTNVSCATALLVDCSHSMVLYGEDRMTPARKVALGLVELIKTKYPRDRLYVIAFGDDAVEVPLKKVPYLTWGPYHTNTKAALEMARKMLVRSKSPNRRIFMITDGKPTVLDEGGRRMIDSSGWNPQIQNRTLEEAAQCRRKNITITTFMVTQDPYLVNFVEELTKINHGRAFYTGLGKLGKFLFADYVKNRKRSM